MDEQNLNKLLEEKMKDLEIVPNPPVRVLPDDLGETRRSTLDLEEVSKKYAASLPGDSSKESKSTAETPAPTSGEVKVKLVRAKDRNQDASNPISVRTVILDKDGIVGSQG